MSPQAAAHTMPFAERYTIVRYPTGGVVVDLISGNYYRLNELAARICDVLVRARDQAHAVDEVSRELAIPAHESAQMVGKAIATLSSHAHRTEVQGAYHFRPNDSGYSLWHAGRRVLDVSAHDLRIALGPDADVGRPAQLEFYVRAVGPKMLFQMGMTVLHASACLVGEKLIAFAGVSGAGKTTTARAFREAGAKLLSEDLVVLAPNADTAKVFTSGEPLVQEWARAGANALIDEPRRAISPEPLRDIAAGKTQSLHSVVILDQARRTGTRFRATSISGADALLALLNHDFLGGKEPAAWRQYVERASALVRLIDVREAHAPGSVEHLATAAAAYISTIAS